LVSFTCLFSSVGALAQADDQNSVRGGPKEGDHFTDPGQSGAALPDMVVEAQNEVRQQIQKSTFEFSLSASSIDSFFTIMDEEALGISPVSGLKPHLNNLERLASDQPPHYWIREMAATPVATFYPEDSEGHQVVGWSLAITDFRGAPFCRFEGKGKPPEKVEWDGRSDRGEMLKVGYPYSYVFSVTDKGTNTYNYAGVSFRIPALDYRQESGRLLEFAGEELFARQESQLTSRGEDWLTRAADEIRRHPYSPVKVLVTAESRELAEERADAVATFLAASMILPREQIETETQPKPDLRAELDGVLRITIEHAD
jgi:hypothetical protein